MKGFYIRIMFGPTTMPHLFGFQTDNDEEAEENFDKAVKAINDIYHTHGRFATKQEVLNHFAQYGFYRIQP